MENLKLKLTDYDKALSKRDMEVRRKQRLAYVGISLDNVLPANKDEIHHKSHSNRDEGVVRFESESQSESSSSSEESDDEPVYQLRERRQAHSYRFNDFDDLINSAIQDEMEEVKGAGNQGRGKDIATIVNAEKEEQEAQMKLNLQEANEEGAAEEPEPLPSVVPRHTSVHSEDSEDEPLTVSRKKLIGRKKHRKLNSLDVSSGDDADSDEDFKGSRYLGVF